MAIKKHLRLILGDQLNPRHSWFEKVEPGVSYTLMEIRQETDYVTHHIQKVAAFFAAMRSFCDHLSAAGHRVIYLRLDDPANRHGFESNVSNLIETHGFDSFSYQTPDEYRLKNAFEKWTKRLPVPTDCVDSEHFLSASDEFARLFKGKKRFLMETFYRHMRKRYDILIDDGRPEGGKWNFDIQNRSRYDQGLPLPEPLCFDNDVADIVAMIEAAHVVTMGKIDPKRLIWPVSVAQSKTLLNEFVTRCLPGFGTYQDAMSVHSWSMFHSRLSFALNTKMLHPLEVIQAVLSAFRAAKGEISIASVEGFVRQILGWREYMHCIYWHLMPAFESMNYFGHAAELPDYYWTGDTKMHCIRQAVTQSLNYAYAHHIQRLMVTGNFALLAGVAPAAVERWYLGIYIDAIQWVELPNSLSMSQYADGGILATKPYVSSARYIHRMSDYCGGCYYKPTESVGPAACPFNALYWDFLIRHRRILKGNARMGMMYRTWDKMDAARRKAIRRQAAKIHGQLARL